MEIEIIQQFSLLDMLAADSLWSRREYPTEVRMQPLVGMCFVVATLLWMVFHQPSGFLVLLVAFLFFWGIYLIVRYPLKRLRNIGRAVWFSRWRISVKSPDVIRFHDYGYDWRVADTIRVHNRWSDLHSVADNQRGLVIRCLNSSDSKKIQFVYVRRKSFGNEDDYQELVSFLQTRLNSSARRTECNQ